MHALAFLLNMLNEEAGEIIQVIGKINRFGLDSTRPGVDEHGNPHRSNRQLLADEINDLRAGVELLAEYLNEADRGGLPGLDDREFIEKRMEKFLHFATISAKAGHLVAGESPLTTDPAAFQQPSN